MLIAWPLAHVAANRWLENFAYRVDPALWVFAMSGVLAVTVALTTVSYHALRASLANPAQSLRTE